MTVSCKINVNTNRKFCKFQCAPTHVFGGINNQPNMRFTKIACKCPRGPNGRKCNWFNKRNKANFQNYECIAKATPAPVSEPGVATTAAATTVAATTGGSGGGSVPVCPTGNTLIMADGTVTCPDGSTPVGGTPVTTPAATTPAATTPAATTPAATTPGATTPA